MKIEATADQIRALLRIAQQDAGTEPRTAKGVPRAVLARYDALLQAGRVPAIAAVERGACAGCHLRLPTMVAQRAAHTLALHTCPHCQRLLYSPELLGDEASGRAKSARRERLEAP